MRDGELLLIATKSPMDELLGPWGWLIGAGASERFALLTLTALGDAFLEEQSTGKVWFLDTLSGTFAVVAPDRAAFQTMLADGEFRRKYLFEFLVHEMRANSVFLELGECYSFKTPIVIGGFADAENTTVVKVEDHFSVLGQLHRQLGEVAEGFEVADVSVAKGRVKVRTRRVSE